MAADGGTGAATPFHAGNGPGPRSTQRLRAVPSADPIERAVQEIRHVVRTGALDMALSVGEIVFRNVYRGNVELLRSTGPKDVSFRRLARHGDLQMSRANLWRAVAIYELSVRFPKLRESKHLSVSHVRAVLGLPPKVQERLLERTERQGLSVSEIEREAALLRNGQGGRPPKPPILKALDGLRRIAGLPVSLFADKRAMKKLSAEDVECAVETLRDIEERLKELRSGLRELGALP